ncbi:alpha/beta-hydrolase [Plenodomus tracheiphilus IPT5]|uniref:Alpha/beta-hydrolase n=1 Tax=Plenodomus tracheiphilus IPT5 TaxID=1408161 RepID=A0A6A7BCQ0_9PLEO|nr:alpha/beta-hydrolase [Plenodomus tracheiphilus IPT5]
MGLLYLSILSFVLASNAQTGLLHVQNNTFNSTYQLTTTQIQNANLSQASAEDIEIALNFERSNWATGSVHDDAFYRPPLENCTSQPGSLLRVDEYTDTTSYTLPPNLALSRILFTSADLNGTAVPASAYVLWPWQARSFADSNLNVSGIPVVAWAHGTSGVFGECAPSHVRNLWYQFSAPYTLALQGYAVVAPDYAGLGVDRTDTGEPILHQYIANPAHANDLFYAVEAAQQAFPELSKQFVVMGHSQGGGAAWGAAQRQVDTPVQGYLGAVAGSPFTDIIENINVLPEVQSLFAWPLAQGMTSIFPGFTLSEWFEEEGIRLVELTQELSACNSAGSQILSQQQGIIKPGWQDNWYTQAFRNLTANGRRPTSGPLLVLHGKEDQVMYEKVAAKVFNETCEMYPESRMQFAAFEGVTHVPVLNAGQQIWLKWIEDRFMGKELESKCIWTEHKSIRPVKSYQKELSYYLQLALEGYTVA